MNKYINKAKNIYKNQGGKALARKFVRFGKTKFLEVVYPNFIVRGYKDLWNEYNFVSNSTFQITVEDIEASSKAIAEKLPKKIRTANWFIEKMSIEGVTNRIIIYDKPSFDVDALRQQIKENFPRLKNYEFIIFDHANDNVDDLPESDIAICSFWISAYILLKFNKTRRKYYFIQDYEPLFYTGGSTYALAESTYRFGFKGIVNTPGLLAAVNQRHGMDGISFVPAVDKAIYYPDKNKDNKKIRIFFYARPNNPRNAFNLCIEIIKQLIDKYGDKIEIITAGSSWNESVFGLSKKITNLGLLGSLEEVASLYRQCDIGVVYMLSKHPSYQPFEFMASGMATVTNNNEDNLWLLKDNENCLIAEPSSAAMVEKIGWLVDDHKLRARISKNGLKTVDSDWDVQINQIWLEIQNNG
jgi:glycosyltransferase involved in cell wall biosynthesis